MLSAALLELAEEEELERGGKPRWLQSQLAPRPVRLTSLREIDRGERRGGERRGGQEEIGDHTGEKIAATASAIGPKSDRRLPVRVLVS